MEATTTKRFRTDLHVVQRSAKDWVLTRPLVWEGDREWFVIRPGFVTDFASIPKSLRWFLDNAGRNAKAAVLHDAAWRESMRPEPRIDPWDADSMFRSALRETGAPALTRGLMWFGVRTGAMVRGRFGRRGPKTWVKALQLLGVFALGTVAALGPTIVVGAGLVVYWAASWIAGAVWAPFERRFGVQTNWPWPGGTGSTREAERATEELLVIIGKDEPAASALEEHLRRSGGQLRAEDLADVLPGKLPEPAVTGELRRPEEVLVDARPGAGTAGPPGHAG